MYKYKPPCSKIHILNLLYFKHLAAPRATLLSDIHVLSLLKSEHRAPPATLPQYSCLESLQLRASSLLFSW